MKLLYCLSVVFAVITGVLLGVATVKIPQYYEKCKDAGGAVIYSQNNHVCIKADSVIVVK